MPSLKPLLLTMLISMPFFVFAQVDFPAPSPVCTLQQKAGLTDITIIYSRPGMKGRTIFGDLVPWDKMWRTGANASTKIEFSKDVEVMGNELPAGQYALYTIPGENEWTIIFHKNTTHWGDGGEDYKPEEDAFRVNVKPELMYPKVESFTIDVNNIRNDSITIDLLWEATKVSIPVHLKTTEEINKKIAETLDGPGWRFYYSSAVFYRESGKDLNQALEWMNKAISMRGETFWILRQKSLILADMEKWEDALMTAKQSLILAKEAGNDDYVRMNEKSMAEWSAKLKE